MDRELRSAKVKFEKEQRERKEQARRKAEKDRRSKEEAVKQRLAIEEAQALLRNQEQEARELMRLQLENDMHVGGGVAFSRVLEAFPIAGDGDKITLPPSALEELTSHAVLDRGPMFFELSLLNSGRSSQPGTANGAVQGEGEGIVYNLRGVASNSVAVPSLVAAAGPYDQVMTDVEGNSGTVVETLFTHAGVLEFTADEGTVGLPPAVRANLIRRSIGIPVGNLVRIRYARLPKGTYAKLQSAAEEGGFDFGDVPNHKAVLETKLRLYSTLTAGDVLDIQHGGEHYALKVVEIVPGGAVTVIETDLEVDVIPSGGGPPGTSSGTQALVPLQLGKSLEGTVGMGQYKYFKFSVEGNMVQSMESGKTDLVVTLEVTGVSGNTGVREGSTELADADVYVSKHPLVHPSRHEHQWMCHDISKTKVLRISPLPKEEAAEKALPGEIQDKLLSPGPSTYSIAVYGFSGNSNFRILVEAKPRVPQDEAKGRKLGMGAESSLGVRQLNIESTSGFVLCGNCKQQVPETSINLHEAYCRRHNVPCGAPGCPVVLRRGSAGEHVHCPECMKAMTSGELEKHKAVFHALLACACGVQLEMNDMVKHKADMCPLRASMCRFCGDSLPTGGSASNPRDHLNGLTQHESECGSRTAPCDTCQRAVALKEMELHIQAVHSSRNGLIPQAPSAKLSDSHMQVPPVSSGIPHGSTGGLPAQQGVECPVCDFHFEGPDSELQLNSHLDWHFPGQTASEVVREVVPADKQVATEQMDLDDSSSPAIGDLNPLSTAGLVQGGIQGLPFANGVVGRDTLTGIREAGEGSAAGGVKKVLRVDCPICGQSVHSERDLSSHIDLVH